MSHEKRARTGGQILVDQLRLHEVDIIFCVPGESYLAVLDAFYDTPDIKIITCRHEAGAANMAEAYGKMTGKPGICFVTRGPGACHSAVGLHTAFQDSTPLILFVGQVARRNLGREAFQEMNMQNFFSENSKWSEEIMEAYRIPELVSQAFHRSTSGRPGPVVLSLPEDMLREAATVSDPVKFQTTYSHPGNKDMQKLRELLAAAKQPVMILGGSTWTPKAVADITAFAETNNLATCTAFRNQDRIDNYHPSYIGELGISSNPNLIDLVQHSDLLIVVGTRLGEQTSQGYTLITLPLPDQFVVHVHPDAQELGRVFQPKLSINAGMPQFAAAAKQLEPVDSSVWSEFRQRARTSYEEDIKIVSSHWALDMGKIMAVLREFLPHDVIITNDAGNFAGWAHRYLPFRIFPSQLGPTSGAMGYGVPAAIAATIIAPNRQVVCFAGDGGFLMSGSDLATCSRYQLKPLIIVVNNNMYGTIRMHQERQFPGRKIATDITNPDFAAYARSFGLHGEVVSLTNQFGPALQRAMKADTASLIELRVDKEVITTRTTLNAIQSKAFSKK